MKRLDGYRMRLVLVVVVAAIVLGSGAAKADFTFGEPTNLGPTVNNSADDGSPSISSDGLELYFSSKRSGGYGNWDIWVSTRATTDDEWGTPVNLGPTVNSTVSDGSPSVSVNGLELFFHSERSSSIGKFDLYVATRTTTHEDWGEPVNLGSPVNVSSGGAYAPSISANGLTLFFDSDRSGGYGGISDIWVTTRFALDEPWEEPINIGSIVNTSAEISPSISADGLWLLFYSWRSGGQGSCDLWLSKRATPSDPWGVPMNIGPPVNSSFCEHDPSLSADGSMLFFDSSRPGGFGSCDLWQTPILPIVDLNGDGIVDADDMCIMVDNWGTDNPLCDIGPMPWGDGIVDVEDLKILAEHLFEEFPPAESIE